MSKTTLTTPIKDEDIEQLNIGDIIYLDGFLITGRDDVHQRVIKQNKELPVDLDGGAIFHAGPIMRKVEDANDADDSDGANEGEPAGETRYEVISVGPTTSMRMERYEHEFIRDTGVKLIVGKGGMGPKTVEACQEYKAIHTVFPGGCAVLAASLVEEVEGVEWLDLGMPEAMWILRVKNFGPLIVSIDTKGNNLFEQNKKIFNEKKEMIVPEINKHVDYL